MGFDDFEEAALRMWAEIPEVYKEGIDGIVVKREAESHPDHDEYFTLGMCLTEPYPSGYMGPDTTRSFLALYWGSFQAVSERNPDFHWEEELWETITHELRHHLEFLAEDDALEGLDYALEQTYHRGQGEDFDPWYYQSGLPLAPGIFRVEYDVYIEESRTPEELERAGTVEFGWDGRRWRIPAPEELGDIHYVWLHGLDAGGGWVQLVLTRKLSFWEKAGRALRKQPLDLLESEAEPQVVGEAPDTPGPEDGRPGRGAGGPPPPPSRSEDPAPTSAEGSEAGHEAMIQDDPEESSG